MFCVGPRLTCSNWIGCSVLFCFDLFYVFLVNLLIKFTLNPG